MTKIRDHFLVKNGFAFKSEDFTITGTPLIKIQNIRQNFIELSLKNSDFLPHSFEEAFSDFIVRQNDLLIALSGTTLGKFAFYDSPQTAFLNQRVALIRPLNENVNIRYLYYYLFQIIESIKYKEKGGAQPNLSTVDIENTDIFIPPIEIQNKIVVALDKIKLINDNRIKTIEILDELVKSIYLSMFGEIKKEWERAIFDDVIKKTQYGLSRSLTNEKTDYPVLRMNNITYDGQLDLASIKWIKLTNEEADEYELKRGDILFNRTNSRELVGKTAVWDNEGKFYFAGYLVRIVVNKRVNPYFVSGFLNSEYGKNMLFNFAHSSGNQANFSPPLLKKQFLYIPPIELQNEFEEKIKSIKLHKYKLEASLDIIETYFRSSIQRVFSNTGEFKKSELNKYLDDELLQEDLLGKMESKDFQDYDEYQKAKKILFELLESGKSIISQYYDKKKKKIKIQIA